MIIIKILGDKRMRLAFISYYIIIVRPCGLQ